MCDKLDNRRTKFILAARERHGDKYDYSQVVFTEESYCKVTIICPVHGPFVQAASSHLQKRKTQAGGYMGCRKCGNDQRPHKSMCADCGCWNKYSGSSKVCKECAKKRKEVRRLRTAMKYLCGECGKPTGSRDKIYCSSMCRTAKNRVKLHCSYCNTEIVKSACQVRRSEKLFCNPECQRLGMIGNGDPNYASKKAKEDWIKAERNRRQKQSIAYKWWRLCNRKIPQPAVMDPWVKRSAAAASALRNRPRPATRTKRLVSGSSWNSAINNGWRKLGSRSAWALKCPWEKKCVNTLSNMAKRRRIKSERKNKKEEGFELTAHEVDRKAEVQMRFEWG
jgi:hypothetical protein